MHPIQNDHIFIEVHESEIPWLKIFTKRKIAEMSEAAPEEKAAIWKALEAIEKIMIELYGPKKINIAQFGNYLPHLHWHIMARFETDSYFPEPMWGVRQREGGYRLARMDELLKRVGQEAL